MLRVTRDGLARWQRAEHFPQESNVEMMPGPPNGQIVQLAGGKRVKIVQVGHGEHTTGGAQPRRRAVSSSPSGGEPRSSSAVWNRSSEKPEPHSLLARSRRFMISSLPQG